MISRGEQANLQELSRFRREGQAIAALHHPNIAQVYDVGEQAGQPYISMELVRGGTLAQFLRGGPLSINDATRLIIMLTDAVGHAHSRGVIHRDLKPSNILLAQAEIQSRTDGETSLFNPKIVDFGLAKRNGIDETATITGMLVDAVKFYSSLLAQQHADDVDARSQYCVALARLGRLQSMLGHIDEGRISLKKAIELQEQLTVAFPERPELHHELAVSHINLGLLDQSTAKEFEAAIDLLEPIKDTYPICRRELAEAMNLLSNTLPPETGVNFHLNVLSIRRLLLQDSPLDPRLQNGLGHTLHNLGLGYHHLGRNEEAVRALEEAKLLFDGLVSEHGEVTDYQESLAECSGTLASIMHTTGQFDRSRNLIECSIAVRNLLVERFPKTPAFAESLARGYLTDAAFLIQLKLFSTAVEQTELAVQIAERLNREYPSQEYQFLITSSLTILATALSGDHQVNQSHEIFERACKAYEDLLEQAPQNLGYLTEAGVHFMNFSNVLRPQNPSQALVYNDRAVDLLEKAYLEQPTRSDFQSYLFNAQGALAQTHEMLRNHLLAVDAWDRAIELTQVERIREIKIARALALARAVRIQQATEAAAELIDLKDLGGGELYNLACLYGLIAKTDPDTPSHFDHAFELLNRPACTDFLSSAENLHQLMKDGDLESIHSDERFQQLVNH